jgi:hypothetical protein
MAVALGVMTDDPGPQGVQTSQPAQIGERVKSVSKHPSGRAGRGSSILVMSYRVLPWQRRSRPG